MLSCSRGTGFLFFTVSFTAFKCVFIAMSTPGLDDQGFGFNFEVEGFGFRVCCACVVFTRSELLPRLGDRGLAFANVHGFTQGV